MRTSQGNTVEPRADGEKKGEGVREAGGGSARLLDFLGLERNVAVMIAATSVQALGTGLWMSYLSKVLKELGATGKMIGLFGTVGALMSALAPYPAGLLSDRLGRGRQLILASLMALTGYAVYLVAPVWWLFIPGLVLVRAAGNFRFLGSLLLTGDRLPQDRRAISIGVQNVVNRLPRVVSPVVGGFMLASLGMVAGFRVAVGVSLGTTLLAILLQKLYYRLPPGRNEGGTLHPLAAFRSMNGALKRLMLADGLARFGSRMCMSFVVLYVMDVLGRGAAVYGMLRALLVATAVAFYVPAAKLADRKGRLGRRPFVALTFLFFAAFPFILVFAPSVGWLIPAFVAGGLREFGEPARKALIIDLIPESARGQQMGTYYMLRGTAILAAPLIGGALWDWRPEAVFLAGGTVSGLGALWFLAESLLFARGPGEPSSTPPAS